jgi:hypothetical protein
MSRYLPHNDTIIILLFPVRDRRGILLEQKIQQMARPAGDSQNKNLETLKNLTWIKTAVQNLKNNSN